MGRGARDKRISLARKEERQIRNGYIPPSKRKSTQEHRIRKYGAACILSLSLAAPIKIPPRISQDNYQNPVTVLVSDYMPPISSQQQPNCGRYTNPSHGMHITCTLKRILFPEKETECLHTDNNDWGKSCPVFQYRFAPDDFKRSLQSRLSNLEQEISGKVPGAVKRHAELSYLAGVDNSEYEMFNLLLKSMQNIEPGTERSKKYIWDSSQE